MSVAVISAIWFCFFFNDTAPTEIYTLSLHDALPIFAEHRAPLGAADAGGRADRRHPPASGRGAPLHRQRSEEHTSELQSRQYLVCRLLLEKKKYGTPVTRMLLGYCIYARQRTTLQST